MKKYTLLALCLAPCALMAQEQSDPSITENETEIGLAHISYEEDADKKPVTRVTVRLPKCPKELSIVGAWVELLNAANLSVYCRKKVTPTADNDWVSVETVFPGAHISIIPNVILEIEEDTTLERRRGTLIRDLTEEETEVETPIEEREVPDADKEKQLPPDIEKQQKFLDPQKPEKNRPKPDPKKKTPVRV